MTLQTSGAISLGNIKNKFGGNASPKLSDYYRGGNFNINPSTNVPTSGSIRLSQFYGLTRYIPVTPSTVTLQWGINNEGSGNLYNQIFVSGQDQGKFLLNGGDPNIVPLHRYLTNPSISVLKLIKVNNTPVNPAEKPTLYFTDSAGTQAMSLSIGADSFISIFKVEFEKPIQNGAYQFITFTYVDSNDDLVVKDVWCGLSN